MTDSQLRKALRVLVDSWKATAVGWGHVERAATECEHEDTARHAKGMREAYCDAAGKVEALLAMEP